MLCSSFCWEEANLLVFREATPPQLAVVGKVEWIKPIQVDDYKFVQDNLKNSRSSVKVAIPSPTMAHFRL